MFSSLSKKFISSLTSSYFFIRMIIIFNQLVYLICVKNKMFWLQLTFFFMSKKKKKRKLLGNKKIQAIKCTIQKAKRKFCLLAVYIHKDRVKSTQYVYHTNSKQKRY